MQLKIDEQDDIYGMCKIFSDVRNHVFWHGREKVGDEVYGGEENAAKIARTLGGQTLEMILLKNSNRKFLEKQGILFRKSDDTEFPMTSIIQDKISWRLCSMLFALSARGDVVSVVQGKDKRPRWDGVGLTEEFNHDSLFKTVELPLMMMNRRVDNIMKASPVDGEIREIVSIQDEFKSMYGHNDVLKVLHQYLGHPQDRYLIRQIVETYQNQREQERNRT